jgi:hypothetical protein
MIANAVPVQTFPKLDIAAITAACEQRVLAACPEHIGSARGFLESLRPDDWAVEVFLPWWLGEAFGLDRETAWELVLGNVLGLAALRLQDDIADDDIDPGDVATATALSTTFYRGAIALYQARFEAGSPLWRELDREMAHWRAATQGQVRGVPAFDVGSPDAWRRLAQRGAPSKISAFAACLLAGRSRAFPVLDECLDHGLAAKVLWDHVEDWRDDLAAGRWNAFVATMTTEPQVPRLREANRSAVLLALMTSDAIPTYFARIQHESLLAATLSDQLQIGPLSAHFRDFGAKTLEQGAMLHYHYRSQVERATVLLFG